MPLSGSGVSTLPNGTRRGSRVPAEHVRIAVRRRQQEAARCASSWNSGEWTDTYGYSQTQTRRSCALIARARRADRESARDPIRSRSASRPSTRRGRRASARRTESCARAASPRRRPLPPASCSTRATPTGRGSSAAPPARVPVSSRVAIDDRRRRVGGEQEEVERFVVDERPRSCGATSRDGRRRASPCPAC